MDNTRPVYNGKMGHPQLNTDRSRTKRSIRNNISERRLTKEHDRNNT